MTNNDEKKRTRQDGTQQKDEGSVGDDCKEGVGGGGGVEQQQLSEGHWRECVAR